MAAVFIVCYDVKKVESRKTETHQRRTTENRNFNMILLYKGWFESSLDYYLCISVKLNDVVKKHFLNT